MREPRAVTRCIVVHIRCLLEADEGTAVTNENEPVVGVTADASIAELLSKSKNQTVVLPSSSSASSTVVDPSPIAPVAWKTRVAIQIPVPESGVKACTCSRKPMSTWLFPGGVGASKSCGGSG